MMEYSDFLKWVIEELPGMLPDDLKDASISEKYVEKLQGMSYQGLVVTPEGKNVGVTINLEDYFNRFRSGEMSLQGLLKEISNLVENSIMQSPEVSIGDLTSYEGMKDKLMIQLVSTSDNREMLKNIPHREVNDLSIVYRFMLSESSLGSASVLVTNDMLKSFGIDDHQLYQDAIQNSEEKFPAKLRSMDDLLRGMMELEVPEENSIGRLYVATCNNGYLGASVIMYQDFMKEAAERFHDSFYVLPSSVHEVILVPEASAPPLKEMQAMVKDINATEVRPEDKLSDSVYRFDRERGELTKTQDELSKKPKAHDAR